MSMHRFLTATSAQLKMTFRRRITLFWSLVFPMILMTLLGLLFGRSISAGTIAVVPVNSPAPQAVMHVLEHTRGVTVKTSPTAAKAIQQVRNGDRDAAIVFVPTHNGSYRVRLFTSNTSADQAGIIKGIVSGAADGVSVAATGHPPALLFQPESVDSASLSYIDFLLPGIFVQSVAFRASQTQIGLSEDLQRGVVDRFRSMPIARSAVLIGRTAADLVRNVLIILLMVAVGYLLGFRFHGGFAQAIGSIAIVSAFGLALSWIFAFVALTVPGTEAAQSAGFIVLFPLVFASSIFVPVTTFPEWLQAFAKSSPVTLTANAARSYALYPGTPGSLGGALAWVGGILAVFIPLSVWRYRRMS